MVLRIILRFILRIILRIARLQIQFGKRSHPVVDAGAYDGHGVGLGAHCIDKAAGCGTQQVLALLGEGGAKGIETGKRHASEEVGKHLLLSLIVGIQFQLHQYQQGGIQGKAHTHAHRATGKAYEGQQRVGMGERAVEVENKYLFHLQINTFLLQFID